MDKLSLNEEEVEHLLHYIYANESDEAEDIDSSEFTHIWTEVGEVNGNEHFLNEDDAKQRIWVATSQNLRYTNISIDTSLKALEFDEECLDEKEIVSWSKFKLNASPKSAAKRVF